MPYDSDTSDLEAASGPHVPGSTSAEVKRSRRPNWEVREIATLLEALKSNPDLLTGTLCEKLPTPVDQRLAWDKVAEAVNKVSSFSRTGVQARHKWKCLKCRVKTKSKSRMLPNGTLPHGCLTELEKKVLVVSGMAPASILSPGSSPNVELKLDCSPARPDDENMHCDDTEMLENSEKDLHPHVSQPPSPIVTEPCSSAHVTCPLIHRVESDYTERELCEADEPFNGNTELKQEDHARSGVTDRYPQLSKKSSQNSSTIPGYRYRPYFPPPASRKFRTSSQHSSSSTTSRYFTCANSSAANQRLLPDNLSRLVQSQKEMCQVQREILLLMKRQEKREERRFALMERRLQIEEQKLALAYRSRNDVDVCSSSKG